MKNILCLILLLFLILSCKEQDSLKPASGSTAEIYLDTALASSGGFERWKKITKLSFVKKTRMFLPDSTIEFEALQRQTYSLHPEFRGEIEYLSDSLERRIIQTGNEVEYFEKGVKITEQEKIEKARTNIRTQFYVIGLPYKLKDKGPRFVRVAEEELADGRLVNGLYLEQRKSLGNNKDENWWVYFDKSNDQMLGYLIEHDNRFSYILNDSTKIVNEFPFPVERRSIAMNNERKNPYLRADYEYSEIEIRLDK